MALVDDVTKDGSIIKYCDESGMALGQVSEENSSTKEYSTFRSCTVRYFSGIEEFGAKKRDQQSKTTRFARLFYT